jgi:hypothetical protein
VHECVEAVAFDPDVLVPCRAYSSKFEFGEKSSLVSLLSFLILLRCDRDCIRSYLELCEVDFYFEPRVLLVTGFSND